MSIVYREINHDKYKYELGEGRSISLFVSEKELKDISMFAFSSRYLDFNVDVMNLIFNIHILPGYCWDGPSGLTIDTPDFMRGSLAHDVMYQLMREGVLPQYFRARADRMLYNRCVTDGMPRFRAWYVWLAVRTFGGKYAARRVPGKVQSKRR